MHEFLVAFWNTQVQTILALVFLDLIFGISAAIKTKTFTFNAIADFIGSNVFPYVLVYGGLQAVLTVGSPGNIVTDTMLGGVFATIVLALVGSILGSAQLLGLNINIPGFQAKVVDPVETPKPTV